MLNYDATVILFETGPMGKPASRRKESAISGRLHGPRSETTDAASGKRERNKGANRAALLDAARHCFLSQGFDSVTVRDIVRGTDLASGTFYNYFRDKEELLREILKTDVDDLNDRMHAARAAAETIEAFIHGAYLALFVKIREEPIFFGLLLRNEHAVRTLFSDTVVGLPMRMLQDDLGAAIARGVFPELDVALLSAAFYGVGFEVGRAVTQRDELAPEAAARFATRLFTRGIDGLALTRLSHTSRKPASTRV